MTRQRDASSQLQRISSLERSHPVLSRCHRGSECPASPSLSTSSGFHKQLSAVSLPFVHFGDTKELFHIHSCVVPFPLCTDLERSLSLVLLEQAKREPKALTGGTREEWPIVPVFRPILLFLSPLSSHPDLGRLRPENGVAPWSVFLHGAQIWDLKLKKMKKF